MEHEIIRDHATKRSRGFGFIVFDNEKVVDSLLANGNMIDMDGTQVSLVQWFINLGVGGHDSCFALKCYRTCSIMMFLCCLRLVIYIHSCQFVCALLFIII